MAKAILEDLGLDPDEHPDIVSELDQDLGEAIMDTVVKALEDHGVSRKDLDLPHPERSETT